MSSQGVLPNFLIVGAMKSGSGSLAHSLRGHPEVFLPSNEVHFFDDDKMFEKGLQAYSTFFEEASDEKAIGEKTPVYCFDPKVPPRIAECLPGVRLVWILRDPVKRAYSHYWYRIERGMERRPPTTAILQELENGEKRQYLSRGRYAEQVRRYLEYFDRTQMLFLLTEDLKVDASTVLLRTCSFLGVSEDVDFGNIVTRRNVTRRPRSVLVQAYGKRLFGSKGTFPRLGRFVWPRIVRYNRRSTAGYPPMPDDLRARLYDYFEPHNEELARLTGLRLDPWKQAVVR